jgi:hypothetical protein
MRPRKRAAGLRASPESKKKEEAKARRRLRGSAHAQIGKGSSLVHGQTLAAPVRWRKDRARNPGPPHRPGTGPLSFSVHVAFMRGGKLGIPEFGGSTKRRYRPARPITFTTGSI